jgi:acetyl esterase/lipase
VLASALGAQTVEENVMYGPDLRLDVYRPSEPSTQTRPAIILIHGGGWMSLDKSTMKGMGNFLAPWRDASPALRAGKGDAPFLVVHGTQDPDVAIDQAQEMVDNLRGTRSIRRWRNGSSSWRLFRSSTTTWGPANE